MSQSKLQTCVDEQCLQRYLREELGEREDQQIRQHIGQCDQCRQSLQRLAADDAMWDGLRDLDAPTTGHEADAGTQIHPVVDLLAPTDDPDSMGRLGSYEILGIIGQGSTGVVLKAHEPRLNRFVAIKVLAPSISHNGAARRRFEREGRAIAAVSHEHVVPIYAVNEYRGIPFIVMQYVPGVSLLQRLRRDGFLDTREVVRIGLQVARGLSAAHDQGIVHRDVKPANVLLEETVDRAVVTDFGLAQVADDATMTRSGTISGTPQYMSPEQARGESVNAQSDLFSLGSLMYAACTARAPFRADTVFGIIHRVCETEPRPIREINPDIAPWLTAFIEKLMHKQPSRRFNSAAEVANLLEQELAHLQNPSAIAEPARSWMPVKVPLVTNQRSQSAVWMLAISIAAATLLVAYLLWKTPQLLTLGIGGGNGTSKVSSPTDASDSGFGMGMLLAPSLAPEDDPVITWTTREGEEGSLTQHFIQRTEQAFEADPDSSIVLDVDHGDLQVRQTELDYVSLVILREISAGTKSEAEKVAEFFTVEIDDGKDLNIKARQTRLRQRQQANVRYGIGVPAGMTLELVAGNGDIDIRAIAGNLDLETIHGDIRVGAVEGNVVATTTGGEIILTEGCSGNVDLMATHGNVCVAGVDGEARLRASDGNIYLGSNSGSVSAHVTGGDVRIASIDGKTGVHVENGNVIANLRSNPMAEANLSVTRGDIKVRLDRDAQVTLAARARNLTHGAEIPFAEDESGLERADLNGGGESLKLTSLTGTISIIADREPAATESLGGSGNPYFSLGGSGNGSARRSASTVALEKTSGNPRPGAMVPIEVQDGGNIDGYTLYLPVSHGQQPDRQWPVLVYLQGGYGVGGPITRLNDWGLPRLLRDESDLTSERNRLLLDSLIVVSIHIDGGNYFDQPETVQKILDDVFLEFGGDSARVYVTGLSSGGHGSLGMCSALPDTFAAAVPIAGRDHEEINYRAFKNTAVWLAHNEGDPTIDFAQGASAIRKIQRRSKVEFTDIKTPLPNSEQLESDYLFSHPDSDRHDAWTEIYCSTQFYRWLLRHARE